VSDKQETIDGLLLEVADEVKAQDAKWGEQNHPLLDQVLLNREGGCTPLRMAQHYEIPTASRAQFLCNSAAENGELTWMHILQEEVSEVCGGLTYAEQRAELIQVAAVVLNCIESLDRQHAADAV